MAELADLIGTRLGNYRLVRLLGRGRMGVVYLAQDEALLRPTAIKIMSWSFSGAPDSRPEAWFLAEARGVASLDHPGVVQVYSVAKHNGFCYVAMEYVEGVSGDRLVSTRGPRPLVEATEIVLQIARALDHAHCRNIIHRDVKPANVLVRTDGAAKLGDFGMALHAASVDPGTYATVGTPHYIAPETWRGAPATRHTDIYALGATYYYFLTGHPPFEAKDVRSLAEEHERSPVPDPVSFDGKVIPDCGRIIRKCMAKRSADRYASCQELSWDLRGVVRRLNCHNIVKAGDVQETDSIDEWSSGHRTAPGPLEPWVGAFGFRRRPFASINPLSCPYQEEPLLGLRKQLAEFLKHPDSGETLVLTGAEGSGRTMLVLQAMADLPGNACAAYMDLRDGEEPLAQELGLSQWACRALGALPCASSRSGRDLEGLLEHLGEKSQSALLVFDSVPARPQFISELSSLSRAAHSTGYMSLVIVGDADLHLQLARNLGEDASVRLLTVPALEPRQTVDYLSSWLSSARNPNAAPVVFTMDAALLIHHRANGNLARINHLAMNTLQVAAMQKRRLLPSWMVWLTPDSESPMPEGAVPRNQPSDWPTPEVLRILNSYRTRCGCMQRQGGTRNTEG